MKKFLVVFSLVGLFFMGCKDSITDEQVKNYENSLNQSMKESLALFDLILAYNGGKVAINDFKCDNKSDYIECVSKTPTITMNEQALLTISDIRVKTNQIYTGKEKNDISFIEAFKGMPSDVKYTKVSFENIVVGDIAKGLFGMLALSNPDFSKFNFLVNDNYGLELTQEFDKVNDLNLSFNIFSKNMKLNSDFHFALGEDFFNILDKAGVKFNVEKQSTNNQALMQNNNLILDKVLLKDRIKLTFSMEDTEAAKQALSFIEADKNDELFKKLSSSILDKKPHKVEVELKLKEKINPNNINEKDFFKLTTMTINGIEITEDLINNY